MTSPNNSLLASTSPEVLMNKGFPVQFVETKPDQSGAYHSHPKKLLEKQYIHIDNETMAAFEDRWGTLDAWEKALNDKVVRNLAATLGIILKWPDERVLKAMRLGGITEYRLAIQGAYSQALGRDPKEVKSLLLKAQGDPDTAATLMEDPDSPFSGTTDASTGASSGASGWGTDTTPTGSGESASDSSSSTSSPWE